MPRVTHGFGARGAKRSPEYIAWDCMKQRCYNPNNVAFSYYGGRGIKVCAAWLKFAGFIKDMGPMPAKGYTVERDDADLDYGPDNCRWLTKKEQRATVRLVRGEARSHLGITDADIVAIRKRALTESRQSIADDYGMSYSMVRKIVLKLCWGHVP